MVTLMVLAALAPVLPSALRTREATAVLVMTGCEPTFFPARNAVPVSERFPPSRLLAMVKVPAATVPS